MTLTNICVKTTSEGADIIADALFNFGAEGVTVYDKNDLSDLYAGGTVWDYIDESLLNASDEVKVCAVIDTDKFPLAVDGLRTDLQRIKNGGFIDAGSCAVELSIVQNTDWREEWRKFFKPIVTQSVTVVPEWIDYTPADGEKVMLINPGQAFGTGEHATTRMCLELLAKVDAKSKRVADVGTGSGILGISAALLGAASVYMCDIDETAVKCANENIQKNGVDKIAVAEVADLLDKRGEIFDIILANLTADILIRLSANALGFLGYGGHMIVSGIITPRKDEVVKAFEKAGFKVENYIEDGDWCALLMRAAD